VSVKIAWPAYASNAIFASDNATTISVSPALVRSPSRRSLRIAYIAPATSIPFNTPERPQ
jgi:hypothetical protein